MLKRTFELNLPYTVVIYVRMSDKKQNERSPDQQIAEIKRRIELLKLNWKIEVFYRDDGVKGALIRKRPQFWRMLNDIYSGAVKTDLILVDTTERFARAKEMNTIREKLWEEYGVLLVTAENNFASPLTPEGKIYAAVEAMRSTEENRIKAHQVLRAKRDAIEQGYWPGGPAPEGFRLQKIIEQDENGNDKFVGSKLVVDSREINVNVVKEAFRVCDKTGMRGSRLAVHLKAMPQFRLDFDKLTGDTVNNWLKNTLFKGVLTWGIYCTGIVNDVRRLERNDEEDVVVKENYCEAIVDEEVWNRVNLGRERPIKSSNDDGAGKLLTPLAPGYKIKYMLSGLTRCACCGGSMNPVANKSKAGVSYVYYRCTHTYDDNCVNRAYIHEPWLREQVIDYIKSHVLGTAGNITDNDRDDDSIHDLPSVAVTEEISSLIVSYLEKQSSAEHDARPAIVSMIAEIDEQFRGWTLTLGNPGLPHEVRRSIEAQFDKAIKSKSGLEESLAELEYLFKAQSFRLDSDTVLKKMERLSDVLARSNPSLANIELSLHIDKILCNTDGTVSVRFCKLGLAGIEAVNAIGLIGSNHSAFDDKDDGGEYACKPRRRARLSASSELYSSWDLESLAHWATDPMRFEGMDDCWFEVVNFVRPEQKSWSEEHAVAVCEFRMTGMTHQQLAGHFGVTTPTIRKALKIGQELDPQFRAAPRKIARSRWHEDNAELIFKTSKTMMMKDMVTHFSKSEVTLRKAIDHATEVLGLS